MVAILLARVRRFPASGLRAAGSGLPDDSGGDILSGRKPGCDGVRRSRLHWSGSSGKFRAEPDDIDQFRRKLGHRAAVSRWSSTSTSPSKKYRPRSTPRKRICPTDFPIPPIYSKTNPADAPILTLALTSKTIPLSQVEDLADTRLAQKISQVPGVGWSASAAAKSPRCAFRSIRPRSRLTESTSRTYAPPSANQPQPAKGTSTGPTGYQIDANDQFCTSEDYKTSSSPTATARRSCSRMWPPSSTGSKTPASRLDERDPAVIVNIQRQPGANIIQVVDRSNAAADAQKQSLRLESQVAILYRPHDDDSRFGRGCRVRADAHGRALVVW